MTDQNRKLYPGVPPQQGAVRLPSLDPRLVYDPPVRPLDVAPSPPAVLGTAKDIEALSVQQTFSTLYQAEQSIYQTHRRWRACDVYATFAFDPADGPQPAFLLSVFVYAVSQDGGRICVASGRLDYRQTFPLPGFPGTTESVAWLVAARSSAQRYEVTARVDGASSAISGTVTLTVVGVDEMTQPPKDIGSISRIGYAGDAAFFGNGTDPCPPLLEVVGVSAINADPAPTLLYLQLFDTEQLNAAALAGSGENPRMVWPVGPGDGTGVVDRRFRYRSVRGVTNPSSPFLVLSSTESVYTPVATGTVALTVN